MKHASIMKSSPKVNYFLVLATKVFLFEDGRMPIISRYLATVRRAMDIPDFLSVSTISLSLSGFFLSSAAMIFLISSCTLFDAMESPLVFWMLLLKKYFNSDEFYVKYDTPIDSVDEGILYVPVVSSLAPVAWAAGADLHVGALDRAFLESLGTVKGVMRKMYPEFSFAGDTLVDRVRTNSFGHGGAAQLFTGGVDSTATYIKHRGERPCLIAFNTYSAFDGRLQGMILDEIRRFAGREGVDVRAVESNLMTFLCEPELLNDFGRPLPTFSWWGSVQHGMGLLGLCAPITAACDIKTVYIGATASKKKSWDMWKAWGSHPCIDNNVKWADVSVFHDGLELSRQEKIGTLIKKFGEDTGTYPRLIVCNRPDRGTAYNCSRCEKCYRTILGLALAGIDPNQCGFKVNGDTFADIKKKLLDRKASLIRGNPNMWRDIQGLIPGAPGGDLYGSKHFFEWFKSHRIPDHVHTIPRFYGLRVRARRAMSYLSWLRSLV